MIAPILFAILNLTQSVSLSLKSDCLIGILFQDQQRCWSRNLLYLWKSCSPILWCTML